MNVEAEVQNIVLFVKTLFWIGVTTGFFVWVAFGIWHYIATRNHNN